MPVCSSVPIRAAVNLCLTTVLRGVARLTIEGSGLAELAQGGGPVSTSTAWVNDLSQICMPSIIYQSSKDTIYHTS